MLICFTIWVEQIFVKSLYNVLSLQQNMELFLILAALLISFILVLITVPPIIRIARAKQLYEPFEERKIHTKIVPPLGGVAIFIAFVLSSIIATDGLSFDSLKYVIAAVIIMFFIGLKDDLLTISARKKFLVQVFAAILLIAMGDIRFTNLHGIFGIYDIGYLTSLTITLLAMIGIINAMNLIDGIDGLASGLTIVASVIFGVWFYMSGNYQLAIMSFALVGSVSGFFLYNVFGQTHKMFMGDTGSLIIGVLMSTLVIKFNQLNLVPDPVNLRSAPAFSLAVIIVPVIDTLRVMTIRMLNKKSPFSADNNHVHHRLLQLLPGSHLRVTLILVGSTLVMTGLAYILTLTLLSSTWQFFMIALFGVLCSFIPSVLLRLKKSKQSKLSAVSA